MKKNRIDFKEKRRYAIKKVSGKTASVFIGATIFGVILSSNLSIDNTKADTVSNTTATTISNKQTSETSNVVTLRDNQKNENNSNKAAGSVQNVTSNAESNVSAENKAPSTENATLKSDTPEASAPAESSANTSAAPAMKMAASTTTGSDRNAATVDGNNVNTQEAEENKKLANETGLTSSDNYSSNIYKGTDGNYYKVITIYGKDYVYRPVKVYANGTARLQRATTERDTRTNIITTKEDLGNGKVKWTVVFFPNKGLQNYNSKLSGLQSAKFGVALTKDYQIIGDVTVNIDSTADTYTAMTGHGSGGDHAFTPEAHVVQSFNPNTDVDPSGWINSSTMPGENNDYILGPYYFTTENSVGKQNLGNTFFKEETVNNNVYTQQQFIGGVHDLWTDNYTIRNEDSNALDGGDYYKKHLIYDPLYNGRYDHTDGFFNSDDFGSAMIFKSHGKSDTPQFSSFTISFVAQHTDSYQSDLAKGPNRQQFSGIIANTYSYQDAYYNMYSISLGEQRSLKKVGKSYVETQPGDKIPNWQKGEDALARINKEYLNDEQINNLKNKIHKNIENSELIEQIVTTGNELNDSMKALGNSVGIYDDNNEYTNRIVDNVKNSDKYIYASKEKQKAYDDAVIAAQNVIDKTKGKYADKTTVETLTKNVNDAFDALDGVKTVNIPTEKVPVKDLNNLSEDEKAQVKKNVEDANKTLIDNGVTVTVDNKGNATITYLDKSTYEISSTDLVEKTNTDADKNEPKVPSDKVKVDDPNKLTDSEKSEVVKAVEDENKDKNGKSTLPEGSKVTVGDNGDVTVTYPDGSKDTIPGEKVVEGKSDAEKNELKVPSDKVKVDNPNKLTEDEKSEVVKAVEDANKDEEGKSTLPEGSKVTVGDNGDVTVTYPDGSKDTIPGDKVVEGKSDAEKNELKVPSDKVKVDNPNKLTEDEKSEVVKAVEDANKDEEGKSTLPEGSKVTVGDNGDVTVTYPDGSKDTIPGDKVVEGKSDAEKNEVKVPGDKVKVDDPNKLTEDEKSEVVKAVEDANKDEEGKSTLPEGSKVTVGDNGDVTVTYPDGSKDTIPGDKVVEGKTTTDSENNEPKVPGDKVKVDDPNKLTDSEKSEVVKAVEDANKDEEGKSTLPEGSKVTVGDNGDVTVTYPDGSKDTIPGDKVVEGKSDADKNELKVPSDKVKVDDPNKLTEDEKSEVVKAVEDANKDENGKSTLPEGSKVTVGDNGDVTVTYPDGSKDTIPGDKVVEGKSDAEKNELKVPSDKVKVDNPNKLTEDEKSEVVKAVEDANKDEEGKSTLPEGSKVTVGDNGDVTVTYPDGSKDTIPGDKVVEGKSDAEKNEVKVPGNKVKVDDPNKLTEDEKSEVVKAVEDANKDEEGKSTLPEGSKVTVGDNGDVTVTYPDGSKDTIPGDKVVEGKSDAEKNELKVPSDKVKVDNPNKLTEDEKSEVVKAVEDANKDEEGKSTLPEGSKVTVGDNGDVTVTYPDGSKDTIPGDKVVEGKSDAEKNEVKVPGDKVKVDDPNKLTEDEKSEVVKAVEDANKDEEGKSTLPEGSKVTVGDNGDVTVTYPDGSKDTIPGDKVVEGKSDADKNELKVPSDKVKVDDPNKLTEDEKSEVVKAVEDANKDENGKSTLPEGSKVTVGDNGDVTVTYSDGSKDTIPGDKVVEGKTTTDSENNEPKVPGDKVKVDDPNKLTDSEKSEVVKAVEDANKDENGKSTLPDGTTVTVGDNGDVTVTYPDGSKDTIPGDKVVEGKTTTDSENNEPKVPGDKVKVDDPNKLTDGEKSEVVKAVEDANKDENGKSTLPDGTTVTVGDNGDVTVTYPDGSKDTIPGDKVVEGKSDAEKNEVKVPGDKVKVDDPNKLTEDEKSEVVKAVEDANKDEEGKSTLPEGSKVTVGDNGDVTVTYSDGSKDTIPGDKVVEGKTTTDSENNEPKVPGDKVKVDDPNKLTDSEKSEVVKAVEDANKDENGKSTLPDGTTVTVGDNGDVTVTYPDGSKDTIPRDKVVEGKTTTESENNEPKVPGDKVKVDDPNKLTDSEKSEVVKAVEDANKDENGKSTLPDGTTVTVGDNGDVTVTYPDGSKDTIPGDKVVEGKTTTDSENNEPKVPGDKVKVDDPNKLTDSEKSEVVKAVEDANKDENGKSTLPDGTTVTVGDNGDVTVTYPDGSKDTIPGDKVVEGKTTTESENNEPKVPGDKVKVDDPNKLTDSEKSEVVKAVEDANKDENGKSTLPDGTTVTVGDNGDVTVTYPDGSKDTIPGDKVVEGKTTTESENNEPKVPGDKVKVDDPNKLTDSEKSEVVKAVEDANKDENGKSTLPDGTTVTVGDNGDVTVTYPDGSKDTIPGDKVVEGKTTTESENNEPKVPGDKVKVDDPNKLTDSEKSEVVKAVEDANKDENGKSTLPDGTTVTVGDNGDVTVTYPDGSKDTIPGDKVVEGKSDAENNEPKVPGDKVKVDDPNKLTEDEKSEVVKAVEDANKDENGKSTLPDGTTVTVGDNGDVTVTYPDGSKDTIPGDKVVEGKTTTESENNEPKVPGDKVKVDDPNKLTEDEKSEVVKAVEDANKDENGKSTLPEGSKVTVGDNGDVTVTYPDGSKDTIPGDKVVEGKSDAENNEPKVPGDKVKVDDPNKLTEDEKSEVVKAVEDANKDENGKSTLPDGTTVTVGDNGDVTVTYPDGSKDTIPGDKVVEGKTTTESENNEPKVPGDKVKVDDPNKLTEDEKSEVVKAVEDANKDENGKSTLPEGSKVTVGDNGDVTVTYPDGSKDTIPGDKVVEGKSDAENNEPKVPGDKVKVDDPNKLTEDEKSEVVKAVEDANKDENGKSTLPDGTTVIVGDNGDVTVTYPDGSKDTIPGDKVVEGKSDAENNEPKVPGDKVKVDDPNKLTDSEKSEVVKAVEDANKDENGKSTLPGGSKVTVGDNGDVTVTYPDGSKDTIPGDKVVEGKSDVKSDAENNEPKEPGDKVKVDDPNKLTDSEKEELSNNLEKLNPGTVVTIADDGTATLTYPDGSTNTIPGSQLVTAKGNGNTTNSNVKVTPTNTNNKINKDNNSLGKNTANAKAGELPQTGETNDSQKLSVIGMALMGILGLFGLGKKRKKD
ncbi:L-asparaginase [Ligilactobacillus salivarius]|uniref:LEA family epithelial adhesin n=1 Tax=Ligilactobacillus salivarius TaxID=1624 RepID=UPI0013DDD1AB|nr:LEA family epithelial adhesin [Ligilactobacillus salivarius]QIG36931.1 L-asparaginase [Ligilactobacillus salivarius]